jgi:hypothetical protein
MKATIFFMYRHQNVVLDSENSFITNKLGWYYEDQRA